MIDVAYAHQAPYTPYSNRTYLYDRFYYVRLRIEARSQYSTLHCNAARKASVRILAPLSSGSHVYVRWITFTR